MADKLENVADLITAVEDKEGNYFIVNYIDLDNQVVNVATDDGDEINISFTELRDGYKIYKQVEMEIF